MADSDDKTHTSNEPAEEPELSPPPSQRLAAPLQVRDPERYDVLGEHGRGGLGKVARAHDKELGRNVAIKELIKRGDIGEIRFLREALITARLEHPGIVPIHEAGRWPDGTPFYVMKLVAGRSLKELLADRRTVEQRLELLPHVVAVADAVAYAHKRKIIHRDLKPANVIVGDFGETVVIDWGLAKDLSHPDEPAPEAGPYRTAALSDLTETGTVLGTPTYMAPEQWRGEAVDQRADVFAIGAMLWEVCSTSKVPPEDPRHRDRLLRKAGIDQDLGAIVAKALSPEPERRYRDAGDLAADLKAFTSGVRIASRRYSLFGTIKHWVRRHRALAFTIALATGIVSVAAVVSVINIAGARNNAEVAQHQAEAEKHRAEDANADLILENGELLLSRDPTAVVSALAKYRGTNILRKNRLLAEAHGRGVADSVFAPLDDTILFLAGTSDGAIFSLGSHRIAVTEHGISKILLRNVSQYPTRAYSAERQVLAYATSDDTIALFDLKSRTITTIDSKKARIIAFSPEGTKLAVGDKEGILTVWSLAPKYEIVHRESLPWAWELLWADANRLIVTSRDLLHSISLNGGRRLTRQTDDARLLDVHNGRLLLSKSNGVIRLLSSDLLPLAELSLCQQELVSAQFAPLVDAIGYACRAGSSVGLLKYDESSQTLRIQDSISTLGQVVQFRVDAFGPWVFAATKLNVLYVYNAITRTTSKYEGQAAQIQTVAPPTPSFDRILVGDVNGTVRTWGLPSRDVRKIYQATYGLSALVVTRDKREAWIGGRDGIIRRIDIASARVLEELVGHSDIIYKIGLTSRGLFSVSRDGTVRTWDNGLTRVFSEHGAVTEAAFHPTLDRIVSIGTDGRMLAWPTTGQDTTLLFKNDKPLSELEILSSNGHIVTYDRSGGVWDISPQGVSSKVRTADGVSITTLRASRDGRHLAVALAGGTVNIYDTASWKILFTAQVGGNVRQIAFDPKGRDLVIASEDGVLHAVALNGRRALPWRQFPARVRNVGYSPAGDIIALVCADGSGWLYYITEDAWVYTRDHDADTRSLAFALNGTVILSIDTAGSVITRNLSSTMNPDETKRPR